MINYRLIYKVLGSLLLLEALFLLCCLGVSLFYFEDDIVAFALSVVAALIGAVVLHFMGREADNALTRRDAYLLVTLTWLMFSVFGSLPFIISGYVTHPVDAFFETMSGFTTTGASVIGRVERLPHGLLFWRSMTQWVGGLGIVFFTIAIIPSMVGGTVRVFAAEATGPMRAKMHPRLGTTAKWIWSIYIALTIACGVLFYVEGMGGFDSVNYAMTITATGGFATHSEATGFYRDTAIDYTAIAFMFLSGVSFTMLYALIFKGQVKRFFSNSEFKLYGTLTIAITVAIGLFLVLANGYTPIDALKSALFQTVSFLTTTGMFNDNVALWPHAVWILLCFCMFVGGCSGSTSGGFKCVRLVMVLKILQNELKHILHPKAVLPVKVNGTTIAYGQQMTLMAFFAAYFVLVLVTHFIMVLTGIDSVNAFAVAMSCASNVGPTLGLEVGSAMSWADFPAIVKWLLSGLMLMGRLEIFSVVVLFTPAFWKDH